MRGKLLRVVIDGDELGLIPAYAGKTLGHFSELFLHAAHPRVCGENSVLAWSIWLRIGSSPHMRGKRFSGVLYDAFKGLIPAYAGKTLAHQSPW